MALLRALLLALVVPIVRVKAYDNGLAITPQMGWNTWNHFGCDISESTILNAAKAMIAKNLTSLGYECEFDSPGLYSLKEPDFCCIDVIMDDCKLFVYMSDLCSQEMPSRP